MFSFSLKIFSPDLALCGWCTQFRGIILSLLFVLLNTCIISELESIYAVLDIYCIIIYNILYRIFFVNFILYIHHPLHSGTEPFLPEKQFVLRKRRFWLPSTWFAFIACVAILHIEYIMTQLFHCSEYFNLCLDCDPLLKVQTHI